DSVKGPLLSTMPNSISIRKHGFSPSIRPPCSSILSAGTKSDTRHHDRDTWQFYPYITKLISYPARTFYVYKRADTLSCVSALFYVNIYPVYPHDLLHGNLNHSHN